MIKAGAISKGTFLLFKNEPYVVTEREFVNPGKGSAFVRVKLKNMRTGLVNRQVIKSQETVEDIDVETKDAQFLYSDGTDLIFMETENYEQIHFPIKGNEEKQSFLKEGDIYQIVLWESRPIDIILPYKMTFTVTEAENAAKGDTVTGATKIVKIETGYSVKVPIFIKAGDKILINTDTGEYLERVN
ncbi:MAG: elongation factor P [Spirochaetales bacterium]|nr:elongation factor P [Spirochaetales bacterium]